MHGGMIVDLRPRAFQPHVVIAQSLEVCVVPIVAAVVVAAVVLI